MYSQKVVSSRELEVPYRSPSSADHLSRKDIPQQDARERNRRVQRGARLPTSAFTRPPMSRDRC